MTWKPVSSQSLPGFFDRVGWTLDLINVVDRAAYQKLIALGRFCESVSVLEIGGGNGWLAERLLGRVMSVGSRYVVSEVSPVLWNTIRTRLAKFGDRVSVVLVGTEDPYPFDQQFDRVVAAYVHDMMPMHLVPWHIEQAHRMLVDGGMLCLLVTAQGNGTLSRIVMGTWQVLYRLHPAIVGGSRPLDVTMLFDPLRWSDLAVTPVSCCGFASKVITARKATAYLPYSSAPIDV